MDTVERLEPNENKWRKCCRLPLARSNAGVCTLDNNIFCIGGWNGQIGIKQCDIYRSAEDKWESISQLNTGRYQAGVCAFQNKLWVAGGSDAWACLNSVETYDPEADKWIFSPSLLTPRRGCGLAEFNGKLYAVGGSDGTHSLSTTEIYDENIKAWIQGPNLTTPRANVSVVVVANKLYAIGGFSGKCFLNTIEYLDSNTNEWTTFVQQDVPVRLEKRMQRLEEELSKILLKTDIEQCEYHINGQDHSDDNQMDTNLREENLIRNDAHTDHNHLNMKATQIENDLKRYAGSIQTNGKKDINNHLDQPNSTSDS